MSTIKKVFTLEVFLVVSMAFAMIFTHVGTLKSQFSLLKELSESPDVWNEMKPVGKVLGYELHEVARSPHPAHQGIKDKFDKIKLSSTFDSFILEQGNRFPVGDEIRMISRQGVLALCRRTINTERLDCKVAKRER